MGSLVWPGLSHGVDGGRRAGAMAPAIDSESPPRRTRQGCRRSGRGREALFQVGRRCEYEAEVPRRSAGAAGMAGGCEQGGPIVSMTGPSWKATFLDCLVNSSMPFGDFVAASGFEESFGEEATSGLSSGVFAASESITRMYLLVSRCPRSPFESRRVRCKHCQTHSVKTEEQR